MKCGSMIAGHVSRSLPPRKKSFHIVVKDPKPIKPIKPMSENAFFVFSSATGLVRTNNFIWITKINHQCSLLFKSNLTLISP